MTTLTLAVKSEESPARKNSAATTTKVNRRGSDYSDQRLDEAVESCSDIPDERPAFVLLPMCYWMKPNYLKMIGHAFTMR